MVPVADEHVAVLAQPGEGGVAVLRDKGGKGGRACGLGRAMKAVCERHAPGLA